MAVKNRTTLKNDLEDGDTFDQAIAGDTVDSALNLADTTAQSIASELKGPVFFATTEVSGPVCKASAAQHATVSASSAAFDAMTVNGAEVLPAGQGAGGMVFLAATAQTTISVAGTYVAVNGTFTAGDYMNEVSAESSGILKYNGTGAKAFHLEAHISMQMPSNNKLASFRVHKNGTAIAGTEIDRFVGTGADTGALSVGALLSANTSAEFQVFCANQTDTTNIDIHKMSFVMHQA